VSVTVPLRHALSVGLVGGFVLGAREALLTLQANAFVQPGQYLWGYLATPVLAWMVLAVVLLLPVGIAVAFVRRGVHAEGLEIYAATLAFAGGLSISLPWAGVILAHLKAVGLPVAFSVRLVVWALAGGLAVVAALIVGSAVRGWAVRAERPLRYATRVAIVLGLVLLWPSGRFLLSDWKRPGEFHPTAARASQPNVLLISIDTLRADHLGSYGDKHGLTPHLDQLAHDGVVFEQTITSSPWTLPAIVSLFTGLYPRHHGAGSIANRLDPLGRSPLPAGTWTLTGELREHGYRTQAIVTNPYLALRYGLGGGFDGYENVTIESEAFLAFNQTTAERLLELVRPDLIVGDRGEVVSAKARQWLSGVGAEPFFLWLHYIDPHPPYSRAGVTQHKSFRSDSLLAPAADVPEATTLTSPDVARLRSGEIRLSPEQKEAVHALYRAEVASVDQAVGAVLEAIDQAGLRERTLVICVADHGEEFWDHGGVEHGHTVYEELVHVPLLMRWPGHLEAGTRIDAVTRIIDLAPTVLELLGMAAPALDGKSLLPLLRGEEQPQRIALSENLLFAEERVGLRTARYKYVRWDTGKEEIYNLEADPEELCDLAGSSGAREALHPLYAAAVGDGAAPRAVQPLLDYRAEAALRALGYLP
jgi:arylsulfatase A-like enzyme